MSRPLIAATSRVRDVALALAAAAFFIPATSWACACGCGVFDVGAQTLLPTDAESGLTVWFRYNYMNQNQNWEGSAKAPASDNGDKEINTQFYTPGFAYAISPDWMVMSELPVYDRQLTTTDDGTVAGPAGSVYTGHLTDFGDLQVTGVYTGLSDDMSTGLSFGLKFPTGNFTGPAGPLGGLEFDRDSLPGTGSTDIMLGGYHIGALDADQTLGWFVQARYQFAVATQDQYRPGNELDGAVGLTYDAGSVGPVDKVAPVLQLIGSWRGRDDGFNADHLNSGYKRLLISPGAEVRLGKLRLYADVEFPIYQFTNAAANLSYEGTSGQLTASTLYKVEVAYDF
jgi:hypothetical protein